ncbi:MAG: hypothetical protein NTZ74_11460 [Chloroflexi bacterium]|nr:hypothetical protein [Chloroflexota bacterium]
MTKKQNILIQISIGLLGIAGGIYVAMTPANSLLHWYDIDDAFYYFKVAQNVLTGYGFSFDQINLSNGFHPLWMVVCLCVFWLSHFNLILPLRVLVVVSALFNALTGVFIYRMLKRSLHSSAALLGALIWILYPPIFGTTIVHGMEASISAFFIVLFLYTSSGYLFFSTGDFFSPKKILLLGFLGGLTILSRLDNVFLVGIVGIFILFKIKKITTLFYIDFIVIGLSVITAWMIRMGSDGIVLNSSSFYAMVAVSLILKPIAYYFSGLYQSQSRWVTIGKAAFASLFSLFVEYGVLFVFYKINLTGMFSNLIIVIDAMVAFILILIMRFMVFKPTRIEVVSPRIAFRILVKGEYKNWIRSAFLFALPIGLLVGSYITFNKITFGTFTPVSGQIKHWWSTLPNTVYSHGNTLPSVLGLSSSGNFGPWSLLISKLEEISYWIVRSIHWNSPRATSVTLFMVWMCSAALIILLLRSKKGGKAPSLLIPPLLVGCLLQASYYFASGYTHTRSWYWIAEMLFLVLFWSVLTDRLFTLLDRPAFRIKPSAILSLLLIMFLFRGHSIFIRSLAPLSVSDENKTAYLAETKELEFYTPPGVNIGMTGGGLVAYFIQDRRIVNLDGLINSAEYFHAMKTGTATEFLDRFPLNYVYGKPYVLLESDPYNKILKNRLTEIGFIRGFENFTLFKYQNNQ